MRWGGGGSWIGLLSQFVRFCPHQTFWLHFHARSKCWCFFLATKPSSSQDDQFSIKSCSRFHLFLKKKKKIFIQSEHFNSAEDKSQLKAKRAGRGNVPNRYYWTVSRSSCALLWTGMYEFAFELEERNPKGKWKLSVLISLWTLRQIVPLVSSLSVSQAAWIYDCLLSSDKQHCQHPYLSFTPRKAGGAILFFYPLEKCLSSK